RRAREAGVVAEVCGILLDEPGAIWHSPLEDRVIGVRPDQLRRARVIAAAPAVGEPEAVIAAARSGLVDDIVLAPELAAQVSALLDCPRWRVADRDEGRIEVADGSRSLSARGGGRLEVADGYGVSPKLVRARPAILGR